MADIELVIKIPEEIYKKIKGAMLICGRRNNKTFGYILFNAVINGTPIPQGHGRLIDADRLREEMEKDVRRAMSFADLTDFVWLAPTIIEEDKGEEE